MKKFWIAVLQIVVFLVCCLSFERYVLQSNAILFYIIIPIAYVSVAYIAQFLICKILNCHLYNVPFIIMTIFIGVDATIHVLSNLLLLSRGEQFSLCLSKIWFYGSLTILIPLLYRLKKLYAN